MDNKGAGGKRSRAEMLEKGGPAGKKGAGGPMNASAQGLTTAQARKVARKKTTSGGLIGEESMMMMGQGHGGMGQVGHTHFFANKEGGTVTHGGADSAAQREHHNMLRMMKEMNASQQGSGGKG